MLFFIKIGILKLYKNRNVPSAPVYSKFEDEKRVVFKINPELQESDLN